MKQKRQLTFMTNKICILLTACVNPNGMQQTILQDASIRLQQYKDALNFYLSITEVPIVVVENTDTDFSIGLKKYIYEGRLEFLTFNGNDFEKKRGKGYGESIILNYAFLKSKILRQSKYVVKITGRLKIKNISSIVNTKFTILDNVCRSIFYKNRFIKTTAFLIKAETLRRFAENDGLKCDDSKGLFFEYMLHDFLAKEHNVLFIPYITPPQIVGISGTHNKPYDVPTIKDNLYISLNGTSNFYRCSDRALMKFLFRLINKIYSVFYSLTTDKNQRISFLDIQG